MKPVMQTAFDAVRGNCLQACLASVLEVPLSAVPNLIEREDWWEAVNEWLDQYGMRMVAFPAGGWSPAGIHLTSGMGARGLEHVVVGKDGVMVHDPHPKGGGLTEEKAHWLFTVDPAIVTVKPQLDCGCGTADRWRWSAAVCGTARSVDTSTRKRVTR